MMDNRTTIHHLIVNCQVWKVAERVVCMGYYPRLRDLREDRDLSIRKLAEILHMQRTTYHNYETGKRELPFDLAVTLANFYHVSLDYIGGLTNDPTQHFKNNHTK